MAPRWSRPPLKEVGTGSYVHKHYIEAVSLGQGLKAITEAIDNRSDFKTYMQNYAYARGSIPRTGPRRDGPAEEGFVSAS